MRRDIRTEFGQRGHKVNDGREFSSFSAIRLSNLILSANLEYKNLTAKVQDAA